MRNSTPLPLLASATLLALALCLPAGEASANRSPDQLKSARVLTEGFLRYHPDIKHRLEGLKHLDDGAPDQAYTEFQRAAKYADKVSQAMVAELLWAGAVDGADRARAYAWMDLAAERGYQVFIAKREQYWAALDADERERAIEVGQEIYAEFGDEVAKPRLERVLKRGRLNITGSRVGFVGALEIQVPGPDGEWIRISGEEYYDDKLWKSGEYFAWQDRTWGGEPIGTVTVGEVNAEDEEAAPKQD